MKKRGCIWITKFISAVIAIVLILAAVCYIVDPFFMYRVKDNTYMLSEGYCLPGIIKNHDYDSLIIGSSMTQNFEMDSFREKLNINPAKIAVGGMTLEDLKNLTKLANKTGRSKSYYICLDLPRFLNDGKKAVMKDYLIDDTILNDYKYLLGYAAWMRFIPVDIGLTAARKLEIPLGKSINNSLSIDKIGYWGDKFQYGEDVVLSNYTNQSYSVSEVISEDYYRDIVHNTDMLIESLEFGKWEYNFFFPPYSILYWTNAQEKGYDEALLKGKEYIFEKLSELGCTVYDFQAADFVLDLDYYKDMTHYSPEINEWMVECFSDKSYITDDRSININNRKILEMIEAFKKNNSEIFEK